MYSNLTPAQIFSLTGEDKARYDRWIEECRRERMRPWEEAMARYEAEARERQRHFALLEDNARVFLDEGPLEYDARSTVSSRQLYRHYCRWCDRLQLPVKPFREFCLHVKEAAPSHRMSCSHSILNEEGKRCRGYRGIRLVTDNCSDNIPG